jgi:hypothetical protein
MDRGLASAYGCVWIGRRGPVRSRVATPIRGRACSIGACTRAVARERDPSRWLDGDPGHRGEAGHRHDRWRPRLRGSTGNVRTAARTVIRLHTAPAGYRSSLFEAVAAATGTQDGLHLTEPGSDLWRERLAFRDALRRDPTLAAEYEVLEAAPPRGVPRRPPGLYGPKAKEPEPGDKHSPPAGLSKMGPEGLEPSTNGL